MGKADHTHKNPRPVIDPECPEREYLRHVLDDVSRYRANIAQIPGGQPRRDGENLPFYSTHTFDVGELLDSKGVWGRGLVGVAGTAGFMVAHHTINPLGLWLTPDLAGAARILGWLHDAALVVVLLCLVSALAQIAWAIRQERRGPQIGAAEQVYRASEGRFVMPDDLDAPARRLLARAQKAIRTVDQSSVNEAGLLDRVRNDVLLPQVEWDLARLLRYTSRLRAEHPEFQREGVFDGTAHGAYLQAQASVALRIETLEQYAERALAADIAYQTAGGTIDAADDLEMLTGQADATGRLFKDSLERVREVAAELTQPPNTSTVPHVADDRSE